MDNKYRVGILSKTKLDEYNRLYGKTNSFFKELISEGKKIDLEVFVFAERNIYFKKNLVSANFMRLNSEGLERWKKEKVEIPKIIYNRYSTISKELELKLKNHNIKVINPIKLIGIAKDKYKSHELFSLLKNIKQAETVLYSQKNLEEMISKYSELYLKPRFGSEGKGILFLKRLENKFEIIFNKEKLEINNLIEIDKLISKNYIIQNNIKIKKYQNSVFDIRVLMQRDKSGKLLFTGSLARLSETGGITSNLSTGGGAIKTSKVINDLFGKGKFKNKYRENIKNISFEIVKKVENKINNQICELGIDILIDEKGNLYLIEINHLPGRAVFKFLGDQYREKAVRRPMEYAKFLIDRGI